MSNIVTQNIKDLMEDKIDFVGSGIYIGHCVLNDEVPLLFNCFDKKQDNLIGFKLDSLGEGRNCKYISNSGGHHET